MNAGERLTRISTQWTALIAAHQDHSAAASLRQELLMRYCPAVYQYLLGAVKNPDTAEDLSHEFAVRFLKGDFSGANPQKGRFRAYLKTALINMVNDLWQQRRRSPIPWQDAFEPTAPDSLANVDFEVCLRESLLDRTWDRLRDSNARLATILRYRVSHPDASSRQIAKEIQLDDGATLSSSAVRKNLERARSRFAELLLDEVAQVTGADSKESLLAELKVLQLHAYCQDRVDTWCLAQKRG